MKAFITDKILVSDDKNETKNACLDDSKNNLSLRGFLRQWECE